LPRLKPGASEASFQEMKSTMIAQFERTYINGLLRAYRGNISKAARAARKDPRALRQLIRKHKIDVRAIKESA
jgi:DNA-binding NtrC family response regulator